MSTLLDLSVLGTLLWSRCQRKLYMPMGQVVIGFRNELWTMKDCETQASSYLLATTQHLVRIYRFLHWNNSINVCALHLSSLLKLCSRGFYHNRPTHRHRRIAASFTFISVKQMKTTHFSFLIPTSPTKRWEEKLALRLLDYSIVQSLIRLHHLPLQVWRSGGDLLWCPLVST